MQIQTDIKTQIQAKLKKCQMIQSNSQYLTVIKRGITDQQKFTKNSLKSFQEYIMIQKNKINHQSFVQLIIQTGYLIYSCKFYQVQMNVYPLNQHFKVQQIIGKGNQKKFRPILFYDINNKKPENMHYCRVVYDCFNYLLNVYSVYQKNVQPQQDLKNQYRKAIPLFMKQYGFLQTNIQSFNNKQRQFFLCLEQTRLFRTYSVLLQILNGSVLDFIKSNPKIFKQFKECKKKDVSLVNQWNTQKKKPKTDNQKLKKKQEQIQKNINYFFKQIKIKQISQDQMTLKSDKDGQAYRLRSQFIIEEKPYGNFFKAVAAINSSINVMIEEEQQMELKAPSKQNFQIEYASDRNAICIKLLSYNVNVNVQSSDFLLFQSNVLTFDSANINIELSDTKQAQKEKMGQKIKPQIARKVLSFKGASCFNTKQPPLEKILLLMDMTMISSKIYEPELMPNRNTCVRQAQKIAIIQKKVNHYTKMFLNCAKKIYNEE